MWTSGGESRARLGGEVVQGVGLGTGGMQRNNQWGAETRLAVGRGTVGVGRTGNTAGGLAGGGGLANRDMEDTWGGISGDQRIRLPALHGGCRASVQRKRLRSDGGDVWAGTGLPSALAARA